MPGTRHFPRMTYHVSRCLREIVAPIQTLPTKQWETLKAEFNNKCAYCGHTATKENRGIVPDHLIPVTRYGELVLGNTVPSCQTCNDSRGEKDWRPFVRERFPEHAENRIAKIEAYIHRHPYHAASPESVFSKEEQDQYSQLFEDWKALLERAEKLQAVVESRRKSK